MAYLLDANVFISANRSHYGFDFCPAFWDWIEREYSQGKVFSIEKVRGELLSIEDEVSDWARHQNPKFFLQADQRAIDAFREVQDWIRSSGKFEPSAITSFLQIADSYLIAQALADKDVIVTHEVPAPSSKKIKIPDVCIGMRIKCVTPFEMLRNEKARFVLQMTERKD